MNSANMVESEKSFQLAENTHKVLSKQAHDELIRRGKIDEYYRIFGEELTNKINKKEVNAWQE